jgi:circadian clock protein KaiB
MKDEKFHLKLFVCGMTPASELAITNVCRIFEGAGRPRFDLQIIDVLERPDIAEREKIIATPTLIKEQPLPREIIIGDLSKRDVVCSFLGIDHNGDGHARDVQGDRK